MVDSHFHEEIFIFIRKDFLDMFQVQDGVVVAGELLSPNWGEYLDDNLDGLPCWMAEVKYKTVNKGRLTECVEEMDKGHGLPREANQELRGTKKVVFTTETQSARRKI